MSAAPRRPDDPDDPPGDEVRPTQEAVLRPTREPRAPFVPGPKLPRVAPAPRAAVRAVPVSVAPGSADVRSPATGAAIVVGSFARARAAAAVVALREQVGSATVLRETRPGPAGLSRELTNAVHRATLAATCAGFVGALMGALLVPSEALVPGFGWLPGPVVGAALLAGILGAGGFALGMLALLAMPARSLAPLAAGDRVLIAVTDADTASAIAAIVALGGAPIAHE